MKIEFVDHDCAARREIVAHIKSVYATSFGADVRNFAPLLVAARGQQGAIHCAAGLRTVENGFFSDAYLEGGFEGALQRATGETVPLNEVVEAVSLASRTPFPVLAMLDQMSKWGRSRGKTCGVFTATAQLRRLLTRSGLSFTCIAPANPAMVGGDDDWGDYYAHDPWVCVCTETQSAPIMLSPRNRAAAGLLRTGTL